MAQHETMDESLRRAAGASQEDSCSWSWWDRATERGWAKTNRSCTQPARLLWQGEGDSEASAGLDIGGKWRIYTVASEGALRHPEQFADSWIQDALSVIRPKLYNCSSCVWLLHGAISFEWEVDSTRGMRWGTRVNLRNGIWLWFFFRWVPKFSVGDTQALLSVWRIQFDPRLQENQMSSLQPCLWALTQEGTKNVREELSPPSAHGKIIESTVHGIHQKNFSITTPYFCPGKRVTSIPLHVNPSPFHHSQPSNIFILLPPRKYLGSRDSGEGKERWGTCCDLLASLVKEKWGKVLLWTRSIFTNS